MCVRVRACVAERRRAAGEGERTRGMQGSSVRGSVVAMGIGGEGQGGGDREERLGRCKRTIKFYGSPELYLSALVCQLWVDGSLHSSESSTSRFEVILFFFYFPPLFLVHARALNKGRIN